MKNELISLKDFVFVCHSLWHVRKMTAEQFRVAILTYTNFLNLKLNIGMFVPAIEVNGKWEVLEEPKKYEKFLFMGDIFGGSIVDKDLDDCRQFQQAKDNVLFEGWEYNENWKALGFNGDKELFIDCDYIFETSTIQDLIKYKPTLTERGMKLAGLNK